jgi:Asp-tRNA(Asn)/Glu-tRNA(Gln) amidotransferase A subunit family amidase
VRARAEGAAALFAEPTEVDLPASRGFYAAFMGEAADVHRSLLGRHAEAYGEDVRVKLERCLAVTDEARADAECGRDAHREAWNQAVADVDVVVTPTLPCVAPLAGLGDAAVRETLISLTYPVSAVGAPALALPCGAAENGLPASIQLVGRAGDDALVLGAGLALESALRSLERGRH